MISGGDNLNRKIWRIHKANEDTIQQLAMELNIHPVIAQILVNRGITDTFSAKTFLSTKLGDLTDPHKIPGVDKAVKLIATKVENQEKILIYGDYDVDGITSTALMVEALANIGALVDYYIPDRIEEGYGLNQDAITEAYQKDYSLIITVDCGITAVDEIRFAKTKGIDMIITDHHEPPELLPEAEAIINPKLWKESEPWFNLAGVGVAFKLVQGLLIHYGREEHLIKYIDLAVLGTIADVVSLKGENRVIVKNGLPLLTNSNRIGLQALINVSGLGGKQINSGHIGFMLAPRLNAAGRIGDPKWGVELLLTSDTEKAKELAKQLDQENINRQNIEAEIAEEAVQLVERNFDFTKQRVIVLAGENWHPGVIGIVASRLMEKFYRPAIVISLDGEIGKGSARSISGFHLFEALEACGETLLKFGGHAMAAGLTVTKENIEIFTKKINDYAFKIMKDVDLFPKVNIDCELDLSLLNEDLVKSLELLSPFGPENPSPLLCCRKNIVLDSRGVGNGGNHLKLKVKKASYTYDGIGFNMGGLHEVAATSEEIDLAFVPEFNEWNGRVSLQLNLKDVKDSSIEDNPFLEKRFLDKLFDEGEQWLEDNWYKNICEKDEFYTKVVGVTFENRQEIIGNLNEGDAILLVREPENIYDSRAIGVYVNKIKIGFLNKQLAKNLAPTIDGGLEYEGFVTQITGGFDKNLGVNIYLKQVKQDSLQKVEVVKNRAELMQSCPEKIKEMIRQTLLGQQTYRPKQHEAITLLEEGYNTLAIFGTGRGKSAIFQTLSASKALIKGQMTIIVYPLRALVNDQFEIMKEKLIPLGLKVAKGNGSLQEKERAEFFYQLQKGMLDIVLTTPEFLAYHLDKFQALGDRLGFFVIDESHHIAKAKQSTRPWYKELGNIREKLNNPLTLAVTATANDQTAQEICDVLKIQRMVIDKHTRDNLEIKDIRNIDKKNTYLLNLVGTGERVVIYVNSRKKALQLADELRQGLPDGADKIAYYHGGLNSEYRNIIEAMYRDGQLTAIVTTSAFGEGIDIPDIQHVVLYHLSFSLTEFNQLSGRAGRNGAIAITHLLYNEKDQQLNDMILSASNPSRETLGKLYLYLKELSKKENPIQISNKEIVKAMENGGTKTFSEQTTTHALGILEDLGLLEREFTEGKRQIIILPSPKEKLELTTSPRFVEGLNEIEEYELFKHIALESSEEELLNQINQPLYPKNDVKLH